MIERLWLVLVQTFGGSVEEISIQIAPEVELEFQLMENRPDTYGGSNNNQGHPEQIEFIARHGEKCVISLTVSFTAGAFVTRHLDFNRRLLRLKPELLDLVVEVNNLVEEVSGKGLFVDETVYPERRKDAEGFFLYQPQQWGEIAELLERRRQGEELFPSSCHAGLLRSAVGNLDNLFEGSMMLSDEEVVSFLSFADSHDGNIRLPDCDLDLVWGFQYWKETSHDDDSKKTIVVIPSQGIILERVYSGGATEMNLWEEVVSIEEWIQRVVHWYKGLKKMTRIFPS